MPGCFTTLMDTMAKLEEQVKMLELQKAEALKNLDRYRKQYHEQCEYVSDEDEERARVATNRPLDPHGIPLDQEEEIQAALEKRKAEMAIWNDLSVELLAAVSPEVLEAKKLQLEAETKRIGRSVNLTVIQEYEEKVKDVREKETEYHKVHEEREQKRQKLEELKAKRLKEFMGLEEEVKRLRKEKLCFARRCTMARSQFSPNVNISV